MQPHQWASGAAMPLEVAPQLSVGARSLGYVEIGHSNALYLSFLPLLGLTMCIIFLVSFLPLVAAFGEMRCYIPFGTFDDLDLTVVANPNSPHSFVPSLALRQISPRSSATDVSSRSYSHTRCLLSLAI